MEQNLPPENAPALEVHKFAFDGHGREMFLIMLTNFIFTVFTFGIYSFWGRVKTRKYIWSHIMFENDRLEYLGTGKELFFPAQWDPKLGIHVT